MAEDLQHRILREYDDSLDLYEGLTVKVHGLIEEILREEGIQVHSITCRVKERESLREKIARPDKSYAELSDLTDIAGVRIITYFEDDVDRVAECIEREFVIDRANTVDKRAALDPDQFGYQTMQHIAEFGPGRTAHIEYRRFSGLKFEAQTRSILQHAWAEIEHDLGYKTRSGVPRGARRRFSALAGLLEIADREFCSLRDELADYERSVPERIETEPQRVEIDKASLLAFIQRPLVATLDEKIASLAGAPISRDSAYLERAVEQDAGRLSFLKIGTIQDLERALAQNRDAILAFANRWLKRPRIGLRSATTRAGISLFYLAYVLAAQTSDERTVEEFVENSGIHPGGVGPSDESFDAVTKGLAERILETYRAIDGNTDER
jgi:putative GTP pyrophosphokinase